RTFTGWSRSNTSRVRRRPRRPACRGVALLQTLSKEPSNLLSALVPARRPGGGEATEQAVLIGLVGRGIESSRSPIMHQREGARLGMDYIYRLIDFDQFDIEDAALGEIVAAAAALGFSGLNVTHPFKQDVIPFLTELSPE